MSVTLNALQLRALAEWASGYRGEVIDFYQEKDGAIRVWRRVNGPCPYPAILTCDTPCVVKDRPRVAVATLGTAEQTLNLLAIPYQNSFVAADAAFWSESAVEKFLFPYYASKGSWEADLYAEALRTTFYGARPMQAYEAVANHPGGYQVVTDISRSKDVNGEDAFGLVHIPKSDYIPQEQAQAMRSEALPLPPLPTGGELGVLLRHRGSGEVRMCMLGEVMRRSAAFPATAPDPDPAGPLHPTESAR
jgi:hypothetical protein